jgi:hypothetical protein
MAAEIKRRILTFPKWITRWRIRDLGASGLGPCVVRVDVGHMDHYPVCPVARAGALAGRQLDDDNGGIAERKLDPMIGDA